jgi:ABC-type uncharacterized transport system auxiliary subunit
MRPTSAFLATAALALAGCISVDVGGRKDAPVVEDRFHVLDSGAPSAAPGAADGPMLAVRPFRAAGRLDKHVLRLAGPGRVAPMDHDWWADEPAEAVTEVVRDTLAGTGRFRAVVDPVASLGAAFWLDGVVQEFAVDAPAAGPARARVRVRFTWTDARSGDVRWTSVHDATEDVPGPGTDGLGPAMSGAVAKAARAALQSWDRSAGAVR